MTDQSDEHSVAVEVVLAIEERCWRRRLRLRAGATAKEALAASGLDDVYQQLAGEPVAQMGIFGRKITADHVMQTGERLALYRPLQADPRQRRRERASKR